MSVFRRVKRDHGRCSKNTVSLFWLEKPRPTPRLRSVLGGPWLDISRVIIIATLLLTLIRVPRTLLRKNMATMLIAHTLLRASHEPPRFRV